MTSFDDILQHNYSRPIVVGNLLPTITKEAAPDLSPTLECDNYDHSLSDNEATPISSPTHVRQSSLSSTAPASPPPEPQITDPAILHPPYKSKLQFYFDSYENYTLESLHPVWADFPLTIE
jgi:hypothetical protein